MMIEVINNSSITYYDEPPLHIREYYNYCLYLLKNSLHQTQKQINVIFGNIPYNNVEGLTTLRIDIQCEHTIVKKEGRDVIEMIFGKTLDSDGNPYLVRIDKFNYLNNLNYIIEYSEPNYQNILTSELFGNYIKKTVVIEPLILEPNFTTENRTEIISLFVPNVSPRRDLMFNQLKKSNDRIRIVSDCFTNNCLTNLYDKTKIIVNIHQTDHHHTFEGLRILPALSQGVIIISEEVPLKESIPYYEYIIWSKYEDLPETLKNVNDNYEYFFKNIFNQTLINLLDTIKSENKSKFLKLLI